MDQQLTVLIPIVSIICVFSWLTVAGWAEARRKEREAYYKSETLKKVAEAQGPAATATLEYLREQEKNAAQRRSEEQIRKASRQREGLTIGGLVNMGVGVGLMIFLHAIIRSEPIYLVGFIPLSIGVALLVYAYFLAPKTRSESQT